MKRARLEHPDRKENKDKGPGVSNDTVSLRTPTWPVWLEGGKQSEGACIYDMEFKFSTMYTGKL